MNTSEHLGLVKHVVKQIYNSNKAKYAGVTFDDCVSMGVIGLSLAASRFDPIRGVKFSTFAVPYIKGEILHQVRQYRWPSHRDRPVPALSWQEKYEKFYEINTQKIDLSLAIDKLPVTHQRIIKLYLEDLNYKEIGQVLNIPASTVKRRFDKALKLLKENLKNGYWVS